jgi:pSer/pThr/pTyr-binding forkhead associated (FHA) protein
VAHNEDTSSIYLEHPRGSIQVRWNHDRIFGREDFSFLTSNESSYISRKGKGGHFVITSDRDIYGYVQFFIQDLGSANGTLVNGIEIQGRHKQVLKDGDSISPGGIIPFRVRTTDMKRGYYSNNLRSGEYSPLAHKSRNKSKLLGKILITVSIISLIISVSVSSFAFLTLNNTYEKALSLFEKVDAMKEYVNTFDNEFDKFDSYLDDIDTKYYKQMISSIKSLKNNQVVTVALTLAGLGSLLDDIDKGIEKFEGILDNIDKIKSDLTQAKKNFSTIKSALSEYDTLKENIASFIKILRAYIIGTMAYCIILNGIILYNGYYLLKLNKS